MRRRRCVWACLPMILCLALCPLAQAAAPRQYQAKIGMYVWGDLAAQAGQDALATAAQDAEALGFNQAIRVYIGPGTFWDPTYKTDNRPLDVKVQRPDYQQLLARFPVVMLTAYDAASFSRYKYEPLSPDLLAQVKDEFRRFTLQLAKQRGRKIISNWEFEHDCPAHLWQGCRAYYQARLDGIRLGKRQSQAAGYPGEVLSCFEFTIVPNFVGKLSGMMEVGQHLRGLDFVSYSAWWSIQQQDAATIRKSFSYVTQMLGNLSRDTKMNTRLIIGEFGEYWNEYPTAERLRVLVDTCLESGVAYLFSWTLYDQPGARDEWGRDASHYGKYDLNRKLTPQGEAFQRWLLPQPPLSRRAAKPKAAAAGKR